METAQQCPVAYMQGQTDEPMLEFTPQRPLSFVELPPRQEKNVGLIVGELLEPVVRAFKEYVYVPVVDTSVSVAQRAWKLLPFSDWSEKRLESEHKAEQVKALLSKGDLFTAFEIAKTIPDVTLRVLTLNDVAAPLSQPTAIKTAEDLRLAKEIVYALIMEQMKLIPDDHQRASVLLKEINPLISTVADFRYAFQAAHAIQNDDVKMGYLFGCIELLIKNSGDLGLAFEAAQLFSNDVSKKKYLWLYSLQLLEQAGDFRHAFDAIQRIPTSQLAGRQAGFTYLIHHLEQNGNRLAGMVIQSKLDKDFGLEHFHGSFDDIMQNRV